MDKMTIERRQPIHMATFWPESVRKERQAYGKTTVWTEGKWTRQRFLIGDGTGPTGNPLIDLMLALQPIALEYSPERHRHKFIDAIRMFERSQRINATGLEYHDYAGSIATLSRESIQYMYHNGTSFALNRDQGVGFRGIVTLTQQPWSLDAFALNWVTKWRLLQMYLGVSLPNITTQEPHMLRAGAAAQLQLLVNTAWLEFTNEPTLEKLTTVIQIEDEIREFVGDVMQHAANLNSWEHMTELKFPSKDAALRLWEISRVLALDYDQTAPWYESLPVEVPTRITMFRRIYMTNGRVNITITPRPSISGMRHPQISAYYHRMTYLPPGPIGIAQVNWNLADRHITPFVGHTLDDLAWDGTMPAMPPWTALMADGPMPEPTLECRTEPVVVDRQMSELMIAALATDKPTLVRMNLNGALAPVLVLPRSFWKVNAVPLFAGARVLTPIQEHAIIKGWATDTTAIPGHFNPAFGPTPAGFIQSPSSGRPIREAATAEFLPSI